MAAKRLFQVIFVYVSLASLLYLTLLLYLSDKDDARLRHILLLDDGYVEIARNFVEQDGSLLHQEVGPGLPLMYAPIFFMPDEYHPVLRYGVTVAINVVSLVFLFLIMRRLRSNDAVFTLAAAFLIINPVFIHWTIKSAPDPLTTALLLIFTYLVLCRGRCWIAALLVHFASLFVRPTALFVPIPLLVVAAVRKEKPLVLFSMILLIFSAIGYWLNNQMTVQPGMDALTTYSSGLHEIVMDAFFIDNVVQTKRFNTGSLDHANGNRPLAHAQYWTWLRANREPSDSRFSLLLKFVQQHPRLLAQKTILNP
ncbi:hypothetical protein EH222_03540, partial [candidate division KSB1 bacterium]